jgi:hypothetical protein
MSSSVILNASPKAQRDELSNTLVGTNGAKPSSQTAHESTFSNELRAKASTRALATESKLCDVAVLLSHSIPSNGHDPVVTTLAFRWDAEVFDHFLLFCPFKRYQVGVGT